MPEGAVTVFTAHGVPRRSRSARAGASPAEVIDATCPLVPKVHNEGRRYAAQGLRGRPDRPRRPSGGGGHARPDRGHGASRPERRGRREARRPPIRSRLAYVTQTTLPSTTPATSSPRCGGASPTIVGPDTRDICYATQNRQTAVRALAREVDVVLVVGAHNSSNSNRLREIGGSLRVAVLSRRGRAAISTRPGSTGSRASASPPAPPRPRNWSRSCVDALGEHSMPPSATLDGVEETVQFRLRPSSPKRPPTAPAAVKRSQEVRVGIPIRQQSQDRRLHPQAAPARARNAIRWC